MTTLSEDQITGYYTKVPVPEVIRGEIATARTCGYAISLGELRKGILGIAVPGMFKIIPFSLAVIVPTLREPDVSGYLPLLLEAVSYITARIG
jgi:DNA-binding IclR family transcriptional regulator